MSELKKRSRIKRSVSRKRYLYNYRLHLPDLMKDFEERCAYSDQHSMRAGGETCMEIDHFNPHLPPERRNKYSNLYLSTRHCNGAKSQNWPTPEQKKLGLRFLDPCSEEDYGIHIFEDPDTFELWGETPAGRYHVRILRLNAPHLVYERRIRHHYGKIFSMKGRVSAKGVPGVDDFVTLDGLVIAREEYERMIRPILQKKKPATAAQSNGAD